MINFEIKVWLLILEKFHALLLACSELIQNLLPENSGQKLVS